MLLQITALLLILVVRAAFASLPSTQRRLWSHERALNSTGCLERLKEDRNHFEICKTKVCFLFLHEEPFVSVRPEMMKEGPKLFPCNAPENVSGIAFDVHNEMRGVNPMCVWAGPNCRFNNMVDFVSKEGELYPDYQFAVTGLLIELPQRIARNLTASTSILDSRLVVMGQQNEAGWQWLEQSVHALYRPFQRGTWILFFIMAALLLTFGMAIVCVFRPDHIGVTEFLAVFIGDQEGGQTIVSANHENGERKILFNSAVMFLRICISLFLLVFFLFYEIAVVNFLFARRVSKISIRNGLNLKEVALLTSAGTEDAWYETVDPTGAIFKNPSDFPWVRCVDTEECFKELLDRKSRVKFMITFSTLAQHQMEKQKACGRLTVYDTKEDLYTFGMGWMFGPSIADKIRRTINQEILRMRMHGQLRQIVSGVASTSLTCGAQATDIEAIVVGVPLLILVVPCQLVLVIILCYAYRRRKEPAYDILREDEIPISHDRRVIGFVRTPIYGDSRVHMPLYPNFEKDL